MGSKTKKLALDTRVFLKAKNARLSVWPAIKDERNPLFGEEKPWEHRFDNLYPNVMYDEEEKIYKCWYSPFTVDAPAKGMPIGERQTVKYPEAPPRGKREMGVCYATSGDGIVWDKPELGIAEYDGNIKNNLVMRGPHGAGVIKDLGEEDPGKRYKMLTAVPGGGMGVSFSADGVRWSAVSPCPEINPYKVDGTHYNTLWVEELGEWVGFTRLRNKRDGGDERIKKLHGAWPLRQVGRTTSPDYLRWTESTAVLEGLDENLQIYSMPVFRYGSVYLGLPVIHNQETDRAWTELAYSPDTIEWHLVCPGSPLIANSDLVGDYDWGCAYSAAYPISLDNEIRLYYGGSNWLHFGWRDAFLCLARLRPDGFAGYEQISPDSAGVVITAPVLCTGNELRLSADVSGIGSVDVKLTDPSGETVLAESDPIGRTVTDAAVQWRDGFSIASASDEKVRIEFAINGARLYSFDLG